MQYPEALLWLERQGGKWAVHATSTDRVVVVASLDAAEVSTAAMNLSCESIDAALIEAVDRLVRDVDSNERDQLARPPRAFLG